MGTTSKKIRLTGSQKPKLERTNSLKLLYGDIQPYKTLSKVQTITLFDMYKNGTEEERQKAIDKLCKHNMRLVISLAREYCSTDDNLNDLIQEGSIGLLKAIEMFDVNNGTPFHGYAMYWIRRYINIFRTNVTPIVQQTNRSKTANVIVTISNELLQKLERVPTPDEILDEYNIRYPEKKIKDTEDLVNVEYVYVDQLEPINEESHEFQAFVDYNNATVSYNNFMADAFNGHKHQMVSQLMDCLTEKERTVVRMLFGLDDGFGHAETFVGSIMGMTQQGINVIYQRAIKKMRNKCVELNYHFAD